MPGTMLTQAARPAPTRSWARDVASKSPGSVVIASTKSLMNPDFPLYNGRKPDTNVELHGPGPAQPRARYAGTTAVPAAAADRQRSAAAPAPYSDLRPP